MLRLVTAALFSVQFASCDPFAQEKIDWPDSKASAKTTIVILEN